jgi:DNA-binding NarL/FixJ family response regulator
MIEVPIEVLIVDDNPIVRAALRHFLNGNDDVRVVGEAADGREAVAVARRLHPAVTLLDHRMPIADGLSVIGELAEESAVLVLTSDSDSDLIANMLRGGARGYLVHGEFDPPELLRAVRAAAGGQGWLSPVAASVAASALREQVSRERASRELDEQLRLARARFGLTEREQDVLALVGEGLSNAAIAGRLVLAEKTVKNHLQHVFAKLQVRSRTEAVARWSNQR